MAELDYEVVVIGGGITGLIVARNFAENGIKVLLLEAGPRLGGRIYDIYHTDYFKASRPHPASQESSICNVIAAGADRFHAEYNEYLMKEIKRYGLQHRHYRDDAKTSYFRSSKLDIKPLYMYLQEELFEGSLTDSPNVSNKVVPPRGASSSGNGGTNGNSSNKISSLTARDRNTKATLSRVIKKMNEDATFFDLSTGFDQIDLREMDCSFTDYMKHHLNLHEEDDEEVIQFLKLQLFLLLGIETDEISTLMVLQQVKQFNGNAKEMLLFPLNYDYLVDGFGTLIECIAEDILRYPGCAISLNTSVIAVTSIISQREIPRVPRYDYPMPSSIMYTTKVKLSTGQELHSLGTIATIPLNTVLSIKFDPILPAQASRGAERCNGSGNSLKVFCYAEGITVRISRLLSKWNYSHGCDMQTLMHKLVDQNDSENHDGRNEEKSVASTTNNLLTRNIMDSEYYDIAKLIASKPHRKKYSVVSLVARREDILQRRIGSIVQTLKLIHPESSVRLDSPYLTFQDLIAQNHLDDSVKHSTEDLTSIFYYDFTRDKMIRSMWLNLRVGTSQLHRQMSTELSFPWGPHNQSLYITGADMSLHWTGWIEGAVYAADQATKVMLPFLFPPKIDRNFAKKATEY